MTTTTVYLLLIEITVLIGGFTAWLIRHSTRSPGKAKKKSNLTLHELEEQLPVPWGWPNYEPRNPRRAVKPEGDEAMHALMECIMMEKRLITEGDLHLHHAGTPNSQPNSAPDSNTRTGKHTSGHEDQSAAGDETISIIDVFGRSKNVLKYSRLGRLASEQAVFRKYETDLSFRQFEEKEILRPWGW